MATEIRISQRIPRDLKADFRRTAKSLGLTEAAALRLVMADFVKRQSENQKPLTA
jgi:antitoxin component of RelBE/YafQ-DinJ toxin-antitoxin module